MNKLDWPGKMSWFTLVLVDDTVQVFFLLLCCAHHDDGDSLGWMTSLCIKAMLKKKREYLVTQKSNKNRPNKQTKNTAHNTGIPLEVKQWN